MKKLKPKNVTICGMGPFPHGYYETPITILLNGDPIAAEDVPPGCSVYSVQSVQYDDRRPKVPTNILAHGTVTEDYFADIIVPFSIDGNVGINQWHSNPSAPTETTIDPATVEQLGDSLAKSIIGYSALLADGKITPDTWRKLTHTLLTLNDITKE